jgi:polynucleotide 5'-hydroxyl-kinase GRC3/NOL9
MMPDVAELDIPPAWLSLARQLAATPARRVVVLGATDVGKSSFCRFLGAQLATRGETLDLLDTDLGQKMIGPPACVTLASCCPSGGLHLKDFRFVGEVSPAIDRAAVVAASARLANRSVADRLIVNTSGLIAGAGILLKRWKLEALNPDHVVGIARGDELAPILATLPQHGIHQLRPSHEARRKSIALRARPSCRALSWRICIVCRCRPIACGFAASAMMTGRIAAWDWSACPTI